MTRVSKHRIVSAAMAAAAGLALVAPVTSASAAPPAPADERRPAVASGCDLGNGVKHVVSLVFDNVHLARDNPDVPSDLEQMPHLMAFLQGNGTLMSNVHTPLIAHTADDSLSIYTGLYGDRHGQPVTNSYRTYNPDGSSDPAGSFAYWTSPVYDTAATPAPGHDTTPTMVYSDTPGSTGTSRQTPAPWAAFTKAGCSVGDFSTANMVLENTKLDLPTVFGAGSPEVAQYTANPDSYKNQETADYVGVALHCAAGDRLCADATAVKYGQTAPSPSAVADSLPTEPGGYAGFSALFGHKYVAPVLGAGTANLTSHGYPVTDSQGRLTDLDGNALINQYSHTPGFPGFNPTATQSLAYMADMLEAGVPVTYGYISDLHERKPGTIGCTTATATAAGKPVGPGDACYVANAKAYDAAFATFFDRLTKDGITKDNTLFLISSEENDQFAGANVGRATVPTPAGCDGVTVPCTYAAGQIGELQTNIKALLSTTASAGTPFQIEPQGASIYVDGRPSPSAPAVRQLQRDTAAMTADNPYSGATGQKIVTYQAGAVEQRILHMQTADTLRTPTYSLFPVPDYYFSTSGPAVSINPSYAYDHGYYSPNIDITWAGLVGPGVAAKGLDGPAPADGNQAHDPNSTRTVPQASTVGTWVEEVDLRPTLMYLAGLHDAYTSDGRVISELLSHPSTALVATQGLASAYHAINSSVGPLATLTLKADSAALASGSATDDARYQATEAALTRILRERDALATQMKAVLDAAARGEDRARGPEPAFGTSRSLTARADNLLREVDRLG
ncbi:MAG: hypothetical protein BGO38_08460 [Cellulomonas sp. 73-145]|uniref:hypothetical protein n=1 Tax=Cellulomonas sp. 73-145 TaxID=1895739 RepID=UPI00092988E5|nr:hypothetical protein [Cellulomonas sp. 73-145]MBN9326300.1 hypothetical protein [Cellulomonas sp.]OJV58213.1 MAG: hypothetical protein BGO38_08460 [Cellulomonas sp. 73-145]